jgi:DNA-binding CsgD family transcriptional regulator
MISERAARRVRDELIRVSHAGLDTLAFRTGVVARLDEIIPSDTYWFPTIDPATLLVTGAVLKNIPEWAAPHFFENEFLHEDFNKFTDLVTGPTPVNSLFEATNGELRRSERYRGLLADLGLGDDLRMALVDGSACWGYLCFHRDRSSPGFTPADTAFLRPLVRHFAAGLRASLLRGAQEGAGAGREPGLIVLAEDMSRVSVNAEGERWLEELGGDRARASRGLPDAVCAPAARLKALERSSQPESLPPPVARARTRAGTWLTLYASRLSGGNDNDSDRDRGRLAVIVEPSEPLDIAPLIVQAYGLSSRERQITMLVLQGLSTKAISRRLRISEYTVQDHLKHIFDKVGVRSRRDLAAQLAVRHYAPQGAFQRYSPRHGLAGSVQHGSWFFDETGR